MSKKIKTYKAVMRDGNLWWHDGYNWDSHVEGIQADIRDIPEGTILMLVNGDWHVGELITPYAERLARELAAVKKERDALAQDNALLADEVRGLEVELRELRLRKLRLRGDDPSV